MTKLDRVKQEVKVPTNLPIAHAIREYIIIQENGRHACDLSKSSAKSIKYLLSLHVRKGAPISKHKCFTPLLHASRFDYAIVMSYAMCWFDYSTIKSFFNHVVLKIHEILSSSYKNNIIWIPLIFIKHITTEQGQKDHTRRTKWTTVYIFKKKKYFQKNIHYSKTAN